MTSNIKENDKTQRAAALATLLGSTYVLHTKTQNFHWNVAGPRFHALHVLFQEHYEELAEAIDLIAERMRMIGAAAPGTLRAFLSLSLIDESEESQTEEQMLATLSRDHEVMIDHIAAAFALVEGDEGTADLLASRIRAHEKMAWMLRSHLEDTSSSASFS